MSDPRWPAVAWWEGLQDGPVLVLGNSLGTTASVWDAQLPALRREFRVLRYELPGHGGSPSWPGPYSIGELGRGLVAFLDAQCLDRVAYCGISLGGMIGMWLAAHAPDRIAALGLICTSARMPPASAWLDRASQVRAAGLASVSEQVLSRWFTAEYAARAPSVTSAFRARLEDSDPEGYASCCEAIAAMDLLGDLPAVTAPTLVIAGAQDPAAPPAHGAAIADRIDGARLVVIPAAAHLAAVSAPDEVTAELISHLRAAKSSGPSWHAER